MMKNFYNFFVSAFLLAIVLCSTNTNAQAVGDYGTGQAAVTWTTAGHWVKCVTAGTWTSATVATSAPGSSNNVWIRAGHTVTTGSSSVSVKNMDIAATGAIKSGSATLTSPVYIKLYGTHLNNAGTVGLSGDALSLQSNNATDTVNQIGSATTTFNRVQSNLTSEFVFNANITILYQGSSVYCNGNNTTFTIGAGKTFTLGSGSYLSVGTSGSAVPGTGAPITVNVYGTLVTTDAQINLQNTAANASTLHVYNGGTITSGHDILANTSGTAATVTVDNGGAINFTGTTRICNLGIASTTINGTIDFGTSSTSTRTLGTATIGSTGKLKLKDGTFPTGSVTLSSGSTVEYYTQASPAVIALPTGVTTYSNLTITNSSGVSIGANTTVNGTLTLQGGNLSTTSSYTLTIGSAGSVTKTSGWVVGNLKKSITSSSPNATFEIGDASYYTPVSVAYSSVTVNGTLTAKTTSGDHPSILSSSGINSASSINRYWTLTNGSITATSYSATFNFNAADIDAGADYTTFVASNYASSAWTALTVGTLAATSTQITGNTLYGDFAIGNAANSNPTISIGGSLTTFGLVVSGTTSATEKKYTVAAVNLTDTLTVTPPAGVLISTTSGAESSSPITLTSVSGTINPPDTIFVKFAPSAIGSFSANIAHSSPGATYQYVSVTGIGEAVEPTTSASALTFSAIAPTSMTVSLTKGNGDRRLVIARASNAVSVTPTDGVSYTASGTYGSGSLVTSGYVVYSDTGNTFSLTGLTEGLIYYFAVYEYNGVPGSGTENYKTTSAATGIRGANIVQSNSSSFTGNWSAGSSWIGGVVPTSSDNVKIGSTAVITIDDASATCNSISFASSTGSKLVFSSSGVLSVYGDFICFSATSNHINGWVAGGKLRFAGSAATQTIKNLSTSAGATTCTPFYEIIVDKSAGKVTTEGNDSKVMLVTSLEVKNGMFQLNTADDIQGWNDTTAATPTVTVDAGGTFDLTGGGANSIRSGTGGQAPIGKLSIAGTVSTFVTTSTLGLSVGGIDILNGGTLFVPSGWGTSQALHAGAITVYSGGVLSFSSTSNVWDSTTVPNTSLDLQAGGIFRASGSTTPFPLARNFTNNGLIQYARSTVSPAQTITDMDYKDIQISTTSCIKNWTLSANRTITGNFTIDAGCTLNTSGSTLNLNGTFDNEGTYNAGSTILSLGSSATVTGDVTTVGSLQTTRPFSGSSPVDVAGMGVSLNPNGFDLGSTVVTRVSGSSAAVTINGNTSINRKWTITPTTQPTDTVSLTFTWPSTDDNGKTLTALHVWRSDDHGATWTDIAGPIDGTNHSVSFTTNSFSDFTMSDEGAPLPVELTSFTANVANNSILLKWNTATEKNNSGFSVERKIKGNFEKIAFVQGNGTSNSPKNYSFTDDKLKDNGKYTYRLKQIDNDGTFQYSKEIELDVKIIPTAFALMQNYPNPFNPTTNIQVAIPVDSKVQISIYNVIGKQVAVLTDRLVEAGNQTFTWNANNFPSGLYYYTIDAKPIDGKNPFKETKKMVLLK